MNKVYKVIWSKIKHCYVVVSELVKCHGKSSKSTIVNSNLERTVMLSLCNSAICIPIMDGFIPPVAANVVKSVNNNSNKLFTITVAAIVKNEVENVSKWVQSARSCADEIVVVDTGSTDDTVKKFREYGIHCYHYDWNDDFSAVKNYMISLCHGDWIVLLDGDEWFREGCDVRKAIAKHHNNLSEKAILADWICLDKDRDNVVMFSGGAVRAFRNQPDIRYFRKVHENLTIKPENFVFEPDLKMYHTGYSQSVNKGKHERNLRIMRTMFDFDNGKVEYPMDWRYIQDTYAGLGEFQKSLDASDKMIAFGVQDYSAPSWITRFNVLFAMNVPLERMDKEFEYCFKTVPSVSGFRFLAAIYYFRNGKADKALDNYIEGLRMLMSPQDKVAQEHTYWRMYMPEASALASTVYLQNKQVEAALYACKVSEQYCGKDNWTNIALDNIRFMVNTKFSSVSFSDKMFSVLCSSKKAVLATALVSTLSFSFMNSVFSAGNVYSSPSSCASGSDSAIVGGHHHNATASGTGVFGGAHGTANAIDAAVFGGSHGTASNLYSAVLGGSNDTASGYYSVAIGGSIITASGNNSVAVGGAGIKAIAKCSVAIGGINSQAQGESSMVIGGYCSIAVGSSSIVLGGDEGRAYGGYSVSIGGGITGDASGTNPATCSVAIGSGATTTRNYEVAIGSAYAPVKIGGNLTVTGTQTVTDGTTTTSWSDILNASGNQYTLPEATSSILGGVKIGSNITNSSGTISLTKDNVTAALGYTPPTTDTNTTYSNMTAATASAAGTAGLVPAPAAGKQNAFLRGDGTWAIPTDTNTTYSAATSSTLGLVKTGANITNSSGTISLTKDNVVAALGYTPPTTDTNTTYSAATSSNLGLVKTGANITNSSGTISLTKDNVTAALGYTPPMQDTNTTYVAATTSVAGLMSASDKVKLDGIASGANAYSLPTATSSVLGGVKVGSNITNSSGTISLTKANVTAALGYTPPTTDTNTTYSNMTAATASAAGTAGLVPAPAAGKQNAFLRGDGTWVVPTDTNTTYSAATSSVLGLVKTGANITNSSGTISLTKDNVVSALGYTPPTTDTNTTYAAMSTDELTAGTATSSRSITAKVLGDYVKGKTNDKISALSINGNVITYTKGDGTTGTITTPNTTYSAGSGLTLSGTTLSVNTNGTATSGNTGVVSGGTLYNAIKDKVKYDGDDKSKISFGGIRGTVLSNLLGTTITVDSTDAVTGSQLYAVKQDISGFAEDIGRHSENIRTLNSSVTSALSSVAASSLLVDTMDVTKADVSLNNLSESGKQVLKSYAATAVQEYIASQGSSPPIAPMASSITNSNTLTVTNAGNGSLHVGEGSYVNGTSSIAIGVGNQVNANNSGAFGDPSIINADASYVLGNDDTINTGAIGSFIVGNDGVSDAKGGLLFGSNTKATIAAENGMALGNNTTVSAKDSIALGSNSIADIENVLSIGNNKLKRKIINVADGDISQNSNEAVTGAQLYVTNEKVQQNTEALEQKADRNASNIQVEDWSTKLGIGKVEDGNANLVTGGTVYQAIHDMNSNSLVQSDGDVLTIGKNNSASKIDVSTADGQNRIIRGVDTDAYDDSSVVNVGYVNAISEGIVNATNKAFQRVDTKINKVGASAAALASLPTPTFDGEEKWAFSAGVGYYRGETAASAGAFYKPQDNVIVRVGGSFGNGDEMVGAGVSVSLNKGDTPVVSKAQLVRTINAQAEKINVQDNEIQNLKAGRVADNQRIAELEAQLVRLTAKVDEMNK